MHIELASIESRAEWFSMIISYLKMKSMAVWFHALPNAPYEHFENAWPSILDEMMYRATQAAIEQLQTIVQVSLN